MTKETAVLTRARRVAFDLKNLTSDLARVRENVGIDHHDRELKGAVDEAVEILFGDVDGSQPSCDDIGRPLPPARLTAARTGS